MAVEVLKVSMEVEVAKGVVVEMVMVEKEEVANKVVVTCRWWKWWKWRLWW